MTCGPSRGRGARWRPLVGALAALCALLALPLAAQAQSIDLNSLPLTGHTVTFKALITSGTQAVGATGFYLYRASPAVGTLDAGDLDVNGSTINTVIYDNRGRLRFEAPAGAGLFTYFQSGGGAGQTITIMEAGATPVSFTVASATSMFGGDTSVVFHPLPSAVDTALAGIASGDRFIIAVSTPGGGGGTSRTPAAGEVAYIDITAPQNASTLFPGTTAAGADLEIASGITISSIRNSGSLFLVQATGSGSLIDWAAGAGAGKSAYLIDWAGSSPSNSDTVREFVVPQRTGVGANLIWWNNSPSFSGRYTFIVADSGLTLTQLRGETSPGPGPDPDTPTVEDADASLVVTVRNGGTAAAAAGTPVPVAVFPAALRSFGYLTDDTEGAVGQLLQDMGETEATWWLPLTRALRASESLQITVPLTGADDVEQVVRLGAEDRVVFTYPRASGNSNPIVVTGLDWRSSGDGPILTMEDGANRVLALEARGDNLELKGSGSTVFATIPIPGRTANVSLTWTTSSSLTLAAGGQTRSASLGAISSTTTLRNATFQTARSGVSANNGSVVAPPANWAQTQAGTSANSWAWRGTAGTTGSRGTSVTYEFDRPDSATLQVSDRSIRFRESPPSPSFELGPAPDIVSAPSLPSGMVPTPEGPASMFVQPIRDAGEASGMPVDSWALLFALVAAAAAAGLMHRWMNNPLIDGGVAALVLSAPVFLSLMGIGLLALCGLAIAATAALLMPAR